MGDHPFPDHLLLFCFFSFVLFLLPQTRPTLLREHHICQHDQKSALWQLQQESFSSTSWKPEMDCCSWERVTCNITTGYVIGLDLSSKLSVPIYSNSSLFGLHHLQRLNLAYNQFEQNPFPSGFDRLPRLTHLNFSENCFSGQVPWEFSRLTRLVSLDLSSWLCHGNTAKLERPNLKELIQNLTFLTELYLDRVDLSAQGSDWSQVLPQFLPNLRALSLVSCGLSGPIHSSFSQLVFLEVLRLSENYIFSFETPKFLATNFSHLKILTLSSCRLHGEFPNDFFHLPNLQVLHVKDNSLLNGQLPEFLHTNVFQDISLSNTKFSGAIPDSIGNLTHLTFLDLTMNHFIGSIPSSLANLTFLAYLDLSYNNFTGSVPPFNKDNVPNLEHLDLSKNHLDGTIHSSLFTLPSLQMLQLSYNQLEGRLESSHNLSSSSLVSIELVGNKLNGQIPKSFSQFSSLSSLYLRSNNFSGTVKLDMFGNLEYLAYLDLSNNSLLVEVGNNSSSFHFQFASLKLGSCHIKEFPEFLRTQKYLQFLDLSNNQIQGLVPSWIWKEDLLEVDLSYNGIVDLEPAFTGHSNPSTLNQLYSLKLTSCNLKAIPEFLKDLNALTDLDLSNNSISGKLPNWIWKESLSELNLSYNSLYAFEQPLLNFPSCPLEILDLSWNKLQGYIPIPSSSIKFFSISNNSFVGGIPESICKLSNLLLFDASHNNLSGSIPECLGNVRTLSVLDVQGNRFHRMPQHFTNASSLKTLKINGNIIEGQVPRSLANCTSLEVLDLGKNKLSDTFPFWLGKLPKLRVLVLHSNRFYGPIEHLGTFNEFPLLQIMDISSNKFAGNLPAEYFQSLRAMMLQKGNKSEAHYIGNPYYMDSVTIMNKGQEMELVKIMTIYTALDLSSNRFHGEIPKVIGELTSLVVLNLSHNDLTGQIPSSIGNMAQLESMDLSQNKLSGQIPWQLSSLTFLAFLNLSQNNLEGPIPRGNQLETFSSTSYSENPGLCGFPLSKKCRNTSDDMPRQGEKSKSTNDFKSVWEFMLMGYGCGTAIGIVIGLIFVKDEWLVRTFRMAPTRRQRKSKRGRLRR